MRLNFIGRLGTGYLTGDKVFNLLERLQLEPLTQAEVVAFCSTRRPSGLVAEDKMLAAILGAGTKWITIFGKSWDLHVTEGLKTNLGENLAMIRDSIEYLVSR